MKLSIIIVTHNGEIWMPRLLQSLDQNLRNTPHPVEVIFVDNASRDNTIRYLEQFSKNHHNVKIIKSPKNLGFANGNNLGYRHSTGELIFLLNQDTYLAPNALNTIIDFFDRHKEVGAAQCLLKQYLLPHHYDSCGDEIVLGLAAILTCYLRRDDDPHCQPICNTTREIDVARGAALIIRREIIKGHLFPLYFLGLGYEDHYLSLKTKLAGKKVVLLKDCVVYHENLRGRPHKVPYMTYNSMGSLIENCAPTHTILLGLLVNTAATFTLKYPLRLLEVVEVLKELRRLRQRCDPQHRRQHYIKWIRTDIAKYLYHRKLTFEIPTKVGPKVRDILHRRA